MEYVCPLGLRVGGAEEIDVPSNVTLNTSMPMSFVKLAAHSTNNETDRECFTWCYFCVMIVSHLHIAIKSNQSRKKENKRKVYVLEYVEGATLQNRSLMRSPAVPGTQMPNPISFESHASQASSHLLPPIPSGNPPKRRGHRSFRNKPKPFFYWR
jgi:hypothetical protein